MEQNLKEVKEQVTLRIPEERVFQVKNRAKTPRHWIDYLEQKKKPVWL